MNDYFKSLIKFIILLLKGIILTGLLSLLLIAIYSIVALTMTKLGIIIGSMASIIIISFIIFNIFYFLKKVGK